MSGIPVFDPAIFDPIVFDLIPLQIKEIITKIIHFLPIQRRHIKISFPVVGSCSRGISSAFEVSGFPLFSLEQKMPGIGFPKLGLQTSFSVNGHPRFHSISRRTISGMLRSKTRAELSILGSPKTSFFRTVIILGKKDFRKLFELLDLLDEE